MVLWIALASVFSVLLGYSRVPYSAALDGNFLSVFAKVHPNETFSSCIAAGAGSAGTYLERDAGFADDDCWNSGGAPDCAIHRAGRGIDVAAAAVGAGTVSVQDVVVSCAGGVDDDWMGVAFLADGVRRGNGDC